MEPKVEKTVRNIVHIIFQNQFYRIYMSANMEKHLQAPLLAVQDWTDWTRMNFGQFLQNSKIFKMFWVNASLQVLSHTDKSLQKWCYIFNNLIK